MSYTDYSADDYVKAAIKRIDAFCLDVGQEPISALAALFVRIELESLFEAGRQHERERIGDAIMNAKVEFPGDRTEPQKWFKRDEVMKAVDV